jgi:hypothetical protein
MRRSGVGSGGGLGMNKNVSVPVRTGSGSHSTRPGYAGQIGASQGSHVTGERDSSYRGEKMHDARSFNPVKFGNEVALNVGPGGCGTGRTLYGKSGSQGQHGSVNPGMAGVPSTKGQWPDAK